MQDNGPMDNTNSKLNMHDRMRRSRERVEEFTAETKAKARRCVRITNNYAHDHPWRIACTSAALAFIAGMVLRGGPSRKRAPRIIVKREVTQPIVQVKKSKPKFELIHALAPLVALGIKALSVARSHPNAHHRSGYKRC